MGILDWIGSAVETVGTFVADTFGGGSANSKLNAQNQQLNASIAQQQALLASYQGTLAELTNKVSSNKIVPYAVAGVGALAVVYMLMNNNKRVYGRR